MAEITHIDFKKRCRVDSLTRLQSVARQVRMFIERETDYAYAVDLVFPDPRRDRRPFIQVSLATCDADLEDRIERGWPQYDFDFVLLGDPEDLPA
jgi:hypothetical protein